MAGSFCAAGPLDAALLEGRALCLAGQMASTVSYEQSGREQPVHMHIPGEGEIMLLRPVKEAKSAA